MASASGISDDLYAGIHNKTMKWIQRMGLWSKKTKMRTVADLRPGDHICYPASASSILYHHAIIRRIISEKEVEVIHFSGPPSGIRPFASVNKKSSAIIRKDVEDLSTLARKGKLYRLDYWNDDYCYSAVDVIYRAEKMIGEPGLRKRGYNLFKNNCEHFATWCKTGNAYSEQSGVKQT